MSLARLLEKGSDLVLSSHFHPSGKREAEKTTIGLYFTDKPKKRFTVFQIPPVYGRLANIDIPAGKSDYRVKDSWKLPVDIDLVTIGGHAHYICKSMRAVATLPDGKIARSEVPQRQLRWFRMFDEDGDGYIDEQELESITGGNKKKE